jgi:hypothetical protein
MSPVTRGNERKVEKYRRANPEKRRQLVEFRIETLCKRLDRVDAHVVAIEKLIFKDDLPDMVFGLLFQIDNFGKQMETRLVRLRDILTEEAVPNDGGKRPRSEDDHGELRQAAVKAGL